MLTFFHIALAAIVCSAAQAQPARDHNPTFSLEVLEVNGIPVQGGSVSELSAAPGDVLLTNVFARDWSPDGEDLRAYQAQIDAPSYITGSSGTIRPVDFANTSEKQEPNPENGFIDRNETRYVFADAQNLSIVDTVAAGYRFLGVLVSPDDSAINTQDGKKYYCGTLRLRVSDDATGTFTIRFDGAPGSTTFQAADRKPIIPVDFESLVVHVTARVLRITSSDPPDDTINAHAAHAASTTPASGWNRVELQFNGDTAPLKRSDFSIDDGSDNPPVIKHLSHTGSVVTLELNRSIAAGAWTKIRHRASQTGTRLASLPGDVNNDGRTDPHDVMALLTYRSATDAAPAYRFDVDGNGTLNAIDVLRIIDEITKPYTFRIKLRG